MVSFVLTFSFPIVNFLHMDSNIPTKPAHGVVISQLVRYLRMYCNYQDFVHRSNYSQPDYLDKDMYVAYHKFSCSTYKLQEAGTTKMAKVASLHLPRS